MLQDCDSAYGLKYVSLRYFNAAGADASGEIGERHEPETHLIPLILKVATGELESIKIFGTDYPTPDGTCIRDYIHVNDLTQAHMLALEALLAGEESSIYNLGNSKGYSVREVIELARKVTGQPIPAVETDRRRGDPAVLIASSAKIRKSLGWEPRYEDLETIIKTAWVWQQREVRRRKKDIH
jgi:UDP-glucose 4-epimerase